MADAYVLFRRLRAGAKFDRKTNKEGLEKFKPPVQHNISSGSKSISEALDFFGNNEKETAQESTTSEHQSRSKEPSKLETGVADVNGKTSKKKKKRTHSESEDSDCENSVEDKTGPKIFAKETSAGKTKKRKELTTEQLAQMHQEKINIFRHENHIYVKGSDVPDPVENFSLLQERYNFPDYIIRNVQDRGYVSPTPIQMQATPLMTHGREVLCCAPTGSGKTAAFILPILHLLKIRPRAVKETGVLGTLLNLKEFSQAFKCPVESPMNPAKKCVIW